MNNTLITQDRLDEIIRLAKSVPYHKKAYGAELGVYKGGSLKTIAQAMPQNNVIGFDSFEGLPKRDWTKDEVHQPGEFADTSLEEVQAFVNLPNVIYVTGLFPASAKKYEAAKFSFVHIDIDFYRGIKKALAWFSDRMTKGGVIVIDDYGWPNCPGVKKALDEYGDYQTTNAKWQAYIQF